MRKFWSWLGDPSSSLGLSVKTKGKAMFESKYDDGIHKKEIIEPFCEVNIEIINKTTHSLPELEKVLQGVVDELEKLGELEDVVKLLIVPNRKGFLVNAMKGK